MTTIRVGEIQMVPGHDEPVHVVGTTLRSAPNGRVTVVVRARTADGALVRIPLGTRI